MKKLYLIVFTVFLNLVLFSCTPTSITDVTATDSDCCGEENENNIPPPAQRLIEN